MSSNGDAYLSLFQGVRLFYVVLQINYKKYIFYKLQLRPDDLIMTKEADKDVKSAQDYIRRLNIVSTKGPQANGPTEFIEEKADPQVVT